MQKADDGNRLSPPAPAGLCDGCRKASTVTSSKGSSFILCEHSKSDPRYPKYPRLPVLQCEAFEKLTSLTR